MLLRLIALLSLLCINGWAQEKTMPLAAYLSMLEKQHDVRFNFMNDDVHGLEIRAMPESQSLDENLRNMQIQTGLTFSLVAPGYVVIYSQRENEPLICGFVRDSTTDTALPFASISTSTGKRTQTDGQGYFALTAPIAGTLHISHLGYQEISIVWTKKEMGSCPIFGLKKQITELEETTVTHFLTRGMQKRADNSYYISPKSTGLLPGLTEPDVLQTLQQLPGIVSIDQSVSNVSVRSGTHDQNLFLWNGIRLFQTGHFFGLISAFNPNLPHAINVYKNGSPASYGESVSGTVLIDSWPAPGQYQERSIGINAVNGDFNTAFNTSSKTYWQFSGRRSFTDLISSPTYKNYFERIFQNTKVTNFFADQVQDFTSEEKFYFYDLTGQVNHQIDAKSSFRANAILISNSLDITQSSHQDSTAETSNLEQSSIAGNMVYERQWSNRHKSTVQAFVSKYQLYSQDHHIENDQVTNQGNNVLDRGISLDHQIHYPQGYAINLGYQASYISIENSDEINIPETYRKTRETLGSQALSLQFNWRRDYLNLSAGVRQNHFASYGHFRTEPRFAVSYQWKNGFKIGLLGESKSQAAHQEIEQRQDFFGIEKRRWHMANGQDVPLIKSHQLSIELQWKRADWLITAEPFLKKVSDITSRSQGFQNQFESLEAIGEYAVHGLEMLVQKQWGHLTGWLNFHINRSEYFFADFTPQVFRNNYETPRALRSGLIYDDKKWQFAIGSIWYAGRYYTEPFSRIPQIDDTGSLLINYNSPNSSRLEDYFQLNWSSSLTFHLHGKWRVKTGFSIQNILDSSTNINKTYRINTQSEVIEEIDSYMLRRTLNTFIRLYF